MRRLLIALLAPLVLAAACTATSPNAPADSVSGRPAVTESRVVTPGSPAAPGAHGSPAFRISGPIQPEAAQAMEHLRVLTDEIGPRVAGTPAERAAIDYAATHFRSLGLAVSVQEFTFPDFQDLGSSVSAGGETIPGNALIGSGSGTVEGLLVPAGLGRQGEFPASVRGNIALVERGIIPFQEKLENALAAGAVGLVVYNNQGGSLNGTLRGGAPVPVLGIERGFGQRLAARAVPAALNVRALFAERRSWNAIADTNPAAERTVVVGAHIDSVADSPGANDNASGTAAILEAARVLAKRPLPFNVRLIAFGAEEVGLLGSRAYVDSLGGQTGDLIGMINLDMVGVGNTVWLGGDPAVLDPARAAASELGVAAREMAGSGGSDHASFRQAGIPGLFMHIAGARVADDPDYHLPSDRATNIDPRNLALVLNLVVRTLDHIAAG